MDTVNIISNFFANEGYKIEVINNVEEANKELRIWVKGNNI